MHQSQSSAAHTNISRLISRRSLVAYISISFLIIVSTFFIQFGLGFQRQMLEMAALTYDQRILLNYTRERVIFLLKNTKSNTPDRFIVDIQQDINDALASIKSNQQRLEQIDENRYNFPITWLFPELQSFEQREAINKISKSFEITEARLNVLVNSNPEMVKTGFNLWTPKDMYIIRNGQYAVELSSLNERVYVSVMHKNETLSVLHNYLVIMMFLSMLVIWVAITHPMSKTIKRQLERIKSNQDDLEYQANHDSLTGLLNRERLNSVIKNKDSIKSSYNLAVMAFDLDEFKVINDGYGHSVGDEVLKCIASRISSTAITDELQFRIGGDEFLIIFEDFKNEEDIINRAKDIVNISKKPIEIAGRVIKASISGGLAFRGNANEKTSDLLSASDIALYHAKEKGGSDCIIYEEIDGQEISKILELEKEIVLGIRDSEFQVYYQPIVSIVEQRVVGLEALTRWIHPNRGILLPDVWLPAAKRIGVLSDISLMTIEKVIKNLNNTPKETVVPVNINITKPLLISGKILKVLLNANKLISEEKQPCVNVEIPESIVLENNFEVILEQLENIQGIGTNIALDDFGTGYATLSHLAHLPFDTLKIDKQFIKDLISNKEHQVVIQAIIDLAKGLGKKLICEGVEDKETTDILLKMGCEYIQGYYFAEPMPIDKINTFINQQY